MRLVKIAETLQPLFVGLKTLQHTVFEDELLPCHSGGGMQTSRRALDRLLDPTNTSVTLHTLQRAAVAIGRQLRLELI